ncbi:MAG: NAD(P)(+) transhydrogenase (Re/Si-specific) subunit beta, partial [Hyphococcus sp.]
MADNLPALLYVAAGILFILALRGLSSPETSRQGNRFGMIGMGIAVVTTLFVLENKGFGTWFFILLAVAAGAFPGAYIARKIPMTAMPQLVAAFHSLVGLAAVFIAWAAFMAPRAFGIGEPNHIHIQSIIEMSLGVAIGAITFSGSVIAFAKLNGNMSGKPILLPFRHSINLGLGLFILLMIGMLMTFEQSATTFFLLTLAAFILGFLIIIPIGGADMPVVVSMLNSYSGWAAAGIGFTLENMALIITGALVGSSGAILSYIMCKGMNRSFISVILGGFGGEDAAAGAGGEETRPVKQGSADDAAFIMKNANKVIVVPG